MKKVRNRFQLGMSNLRAVAIAGGSVEAKDEDEVIAAWQHLHNHKFGYRMHARIRDTLKRLHKNGIVQ